MPGKKIVKWRPAPRKASVINMLLKRKGVPLGVRALVWKNLKGSSVSNKYSAKYQGAKSRNTMRRVLRTAMRKRYRKKKSKAAWNKVMFG